MSPSTSSRTSTKPAAKGKVSKATANSTYWKLPVYEQVTTAADARKMLNARGFRCHSNTTKDRALRLLGRAERGLISYEALSVATLRGLCKARKLDRLTQRLGRTKKAPRKTALVFAPEMRLRIYGFHLSSFGPLDRPAQPPITRVSSLPRQEALPLFYQTCSFTITIDPQRSHRPEDPSELAFNAARFFAFTADESLAEVRHLRLEVKNPEYAMKEMQLAFDVDLRATEPEARMIQVTEGRIDVFDQSLQGWRADVEKGLRRAVDEIAGCEGTKKLQGGDGEVLRAACDLYDV